MHARRPFSRHNCRQRRASGCGSSSARSFRDEQFVGHAKRWPVLSTSRWARADVVSPKACSGSSSCWTTPPIAVRLSFWRCRVCAWNYSPACSTTSAVVLDNDGIGLFKLAPAKMAEYDSLALGQIQQKHLAQQGGPLPNPIKCREIVPQRRSDPCWNRRNQDRKCSG